MSHRYSSLAAVCVAALLIVPAFAQTENNPTTNPANAAGTPLSHADKTFFRKAAKGGMKEVDVSQAVMPKLADASVRQFAQTMVTDHTAANKQLALLAEAKGVELPPQNDEMTKKWSNKSGDVDKDYVREMIADHRKTIALFEKASKSEDLEIATFAKNILPTLQHHLEMAQGLPGAEQ